MVYAREQNVYVLKIVFFWKLFDFSKFFSEPGIFCFHYHIHGRSQKFFWGGKVGILLIYYTGCWQCKWTVTKREKKTWPMLPQRKWPTEKSQKWRFVGGNASFHTLYKTTLLLSAVTVSLHYLSRCLRSKGNATALRRPCLPLSAVTASLHYLPRCLRSTVTWGKTITAVTWSEHMKIRCHVIIM